MYIKKLLLFIELTNKLPDQLITGRLTGLEPEYVILPKNFNYDILPIANMILVIISVFAIIFHFTEE